MSTAATTIGRGQARQNDRGDDEISQEVLDQPMQPEADLPSGRDSEATAIATISTAPAIASHRELEWQNSFCRSCSSGTRYCAATLEDAA